MSPRLRCWRPTNFVVLAACCEFTSRMSAAPRMLSLMTLFSQSIASCACA